MPASAQPTRRTSVSLPAVLGLDQIAGCDKGSRAFFFKSPLIQQRLSVLNQMVGSRSMLIVVIGERGSGKTTLMREFITMTAHHWQACRFKLKSRTGNTGRPWENLNNRSVYRTVDERPPSLIIDDAHQLAPAELKKLLQSAFANPERRKFQSIVMFSEPQIRKRFGDIARWLPPKSVVEKIFMTPLSEKQTADYLKHRLRAAGLIRPTPFTPEQIRDIHMRSAGLPGRINGEAFLLLKKMSRGMHRFKPSLVARLFRWQDIVKWKTARVFNLSIFSKGFGLHLKP